MEKEHLFTRLHDQTWQHRFHNEPSGTTVAGFTTRNGGVSEGPFVSNNLGFHVPDSPEHVLQNRRSLASILDTSLDQWVFSEQTHRDQIVKIPKALAGSGSTGMHDWIRDTDGLYTSEPDLVLALLYADCVPLFFHDHRKGLIGIAHAGWQGSVQNIAGKMIQLWIEHEQCAYDDITVIIGPAISATRYQVDQRVIDAVDDTLKELEIDDQPYKEVTPGQYALDLKRFNLLLLLREGLDPSQVKITGTCVFDEEDTFFSHRRDRGQTGRMAGWITRYSSTSD